MRRFVPVGLVVVGLIIPQATTARMNPLRGISQMAVRSDVLIILDTSGSMNIRVDPGNPSTTKTSGTDCGGNVNGANTRIGTVDLCGDGICSGWEAYNTSCGYPYEPDSSCTTIACSDDCTLYHNYDNVGSDSSGVTHAGSPPACIHQVQHSRSFMAKRALRTVLPELRKSANFGLMSFMQTGYYKYYNASSSATSRKVSIFLTEWELRNLEMWSAGPVTTCDPATDSCGWRGSTWTGVALDRLDQAVDGTVITVDKDSLYRRSDDSTVEARFKWATAGYKYDDGTHTWDYIGSYYVYTQQGIADSGSPAPIGAYRGPQYTEGGNTYVYRRYYPGCYAGTSQQGIDGGTKDGLIRELVTSPADQAEADAKVGRMLGHLNTVTNGGLLFAGTTPTGEALQRALQLFRDRADGTGSYASIGADSFEECRNRFALVITDGDSRGDDPIPEARRLYCEYCNDKSDCLSSGPDTTNCDENHADYNPIRTFVVALPGLNAAGVTEVNGIADAGDPLNSSAAPFFANNESQLVDAIRSTLTAAVTADFTSSAAGIASSGASTTQGDVAILPSVEYPGWKGHLRAIDLTQNPTVEKWDAAANLNAGTWNARRVFTGHPHHANGDPVELFTTSVNVSDIRTVWGLAGSTVVSGLADAEIIVFVEWLMGNGRTHRLPPIIRSTPATVGPPAPRTVKDHGTWASGLSGRETLVYVASNEGLIHAFRADETHGGDEVFAFIPPNLLDAAYALYAQGGQDDSVANFKWILASSPRVADVYDSSTGWSTQLVMTMGPMQHGMVTLDITNPTDCSSTPCSLRPTPFTVVSLVRKDGAGEVMETAPSASTSVTFPEAWSVPAMFWTLGTGDEAQCRAGMGAGYGAPTSLDKYVTATKGHDYRYFGTLWDPPSLVSQDPPGTPKVDYAVLANTAAVVDADNKRRIIATYQADLGGRLVRYGAGDIPPSTTRTVLVGPDAANPFYYSPAVLHLGSNKVVMAANSGTSDEDDPPSPDIESQLYMLAETGGALDTDYSFTCKVSQLDTCLANPHGFSTLPTAAAKPVSTPLLLLNNPDGTERVEAFFLLYETTGSSCASAFGTSWLIRVAFDATGATARLEDVQSVAGHTSGMSLAGGATRVVLTKSGEGGGGNAANVDHLGDPVPAGSLTNLPPRIESWREVR